METHALDGKIAVVTGAARGIGRAAAVALADVVGIDICAAVSPRLDSTPASAEELATTGAGVEAAGRRWRELVVDQRDIGALREAAATVKSEMGGLDVFFATAGIQGFKPLLEMEDSDWHDTIDVNLSGTANAIRAFGPLLVERGGGRIIVTSSTQGQLGTLNGAAYSASKWGLLGLVKSAALELGPAGITVNAVVPGLVDTALARHEDRYAQVLQEGGHGPSGDSATDEATAKGMLQNRSPLGVPWIEPEDIAPLVVFLASPAARMVSGASFAATVGDSAHFTA
jgi:NAD(P)-dependent dehydrogenase (short-subunit alcohol dehydrogenase family)